MKQCPVCKENFADEFSFCDLDGTQLDGDSKLPVVASSTGGAGKLWPIVGVVLVFCAVATVVGSIIFFPRALSAPPPITQSQGTMSSSPKSSSGSPFSPSTDSTQTANALPPSDAPDEAKTAKMNDSGDATLAALRANSKKNAAQHDAESADQPLDPKSAVKPASDLQPNDAGDADSTRPIKASANPIDTKPPVKDVTTTSTGETSAAGAAGTPTTSTQAKRRSARAASSSADDDAALNKNEKKKKGGFLKVFKKIFGQG